MLHQLSRAVAISWAAADWSLHSAAKHSPYAQLHSRLHAAPPPPTWPLPFKFTLQPGSPSPSLYKSRPVIVYVFGGDMDWLHIDTSLLLALPAPAKNIVFVKDLAAPAAADVVLFSCRFARCRFWPMAAYFMQVI